ncbi:D-alanine aminotransferase [Erysipelotrichaceae bacterium]|nr:D-alanine aminotransferase [Erysipelotrichaceae bacterium]
MKVIWKSKIVEEEQVKVDFHDRGYQFGDGIYEVIRVHNGKLFTMKEHLDRLFNGARKIEMELPFTRVAVEELLIELVSVNRLDTGYVYFQVSRGDGIARNHFFPTLAESTPVLSGFTVVMGRQIEKITSGVGAVIIPDMRWLRCDVKSISLLGNVLAKNEAKKANVQEVIQHRDGILTEGSTSNIIVVKDGSLWSHPDDNYILAGITKIVALTEARKLGIPINECTFDIAILNTADEVFLLSTTAEIMPIIEIDGKKIGAGIPGPITKKLQKAYIAAIENECGKIL